MDKETFVMKIGNITVDSYKELLLSKLREEVYAFLLSRKDEDEYYDFFSKTDLEKELISVITEELEQGGWKHQIGFGGSALFVFTNEVPKTCWG
jgi:predicted house-cleaning noncanonical NTP pyrophosphatase (MazG superfamily)